MSQSIWNTINPATTSGTQLASILDDFKDAVASGFSGTVRPTNLNAYGYWVDTTNSASGLLSLKLYDGTSDIEMFQLNTTTEAIVIGDISDEINIIKQTDDSIGASVKFDKSRISGGGQTLTNDIIANLEFIGHDGSDVPYTLGRVRAIGTDDITSTSRGCDLVFYLTNSSSGSLVEVARMVNRNLGVGTDSPDVTIHANSTSTSTAGVKASAIEDSAGGINIIINKERSSGSGQTLASDVIGALKFTGTDQNGDEVEIAKIETTLNENTTDGAQGATVAISTKDDASSSYTSRISINDGTVTINGNLDVTGTTTSIQTTNTEITDKNITINNGGDDASSEGAGITVERTGTDGSIIYATAATSKFKVGDVGSEIEVADISSTQELTNKTLQGIGFEYSETITEGDLLKVINDSGAKVSRIIGSGALVTEYGTEVVAESTAIGYLKCVYDTSNDKVVLGYAGGSISSLTLVVGSISGDAVTFGTPVTYTDHTVDDEFTMAFDATNGKVVVLYIKSGSLLGYGVVYTVSGESISSGTPTQFSSGLSGYMCACYDSTNGKIVTFYRNNADSDYATCVVGTVSGTSISFGSEVRVAAAVLGDGGGCCFDTTTDQVIYTYRNNSNSSYGTAVVGAVSGTSISFGTPVVFNSGNTGNARCCYDEAHAKVVIAYRDYGNSSYGTAIVGTVSGTSISFGTEVTFNTDTTAWLDCAYLTDSETFIITFMGTTNYGYSTIGTVSGTSMSFTALVTFNSGTTYSTSCAYDPDTDSVFVGYRDASNSAYPTGIVQTTSNALDIDNFYGIAQESGTAGQTKIVACFGDTSTIHTGATPGTIAYIQPAGTLSTTVTDYPVGRYVSATNLKLFNNIITTV